VETEPKAIKEGAQGQERFSGVLQERPISGGIPPDNLNPDTDTPRTGQKEDKRGSQKQSLLAWKIQKKN
jgi:hypothetical protein